MNEKIRPLIKYKIGELPYSNDKYRAVATGEFRPPKAGEWYLSGCFILGYQAVKDFTSSYHIAKLVRC